MQMIDRKSFGKNTKPWKKLNRGPKKLNRGPSHLSFLHAGWIVIEGK
jgi:hypothetical protein